jgi:hypothetical protein
MRIIIASIVIAPLMLSGALREAAAQSTPSSASTQAAADRDTYAQQTRDSMQQWQQKLQTFGETAKAKGQEAGSAAQSDLNKAWADAQVQAHKVETASAEGWATAKASFEKASQGLADAWNKVRP